MSPTRRLRRTFLLLTLSILAVFAALLLGLTLKLRAGLRTQVEHREADAIHAVTVMEINASEARLSKLGVEMTSDDVFAAVLESSRLSGVLAVQLFDPSGALRESLPAMGADAVGVTPWWSRSLTAPEVRFHPAGTLEQVYGVPSDANATRTPLLEVVVPLGLQRGSGSLGSARYWIDGNRLASEFRRMDQSLLTQAGLGYAGAAALLTLLVVFTYHRLAAAQQRLIDQSADLARANQELDFAAKTGALGAISAHLIHGLKNPLAGLEGFVADATTGDETVRGEARQTAMETARRLRAIVNEVVTVLRDERSGSADYPVTLREAIASVQSRAEPIATAAGVKLTCVVTSDGELKARTASLAGLVLANLIGNAIEASPRDSGVDVAARKSENEIEFTVTDHGPGLPPSVRESLFRPVVSTKPGGGGMGLAISHRLARHAEGDLSLIRSDAAGTVFCLKVPAAKG